MEFEERRSRPADCIHFFSRGSLYTNVPTGTTSGWASASAAPALRLFMLRIASGLDGSPHTLRLKSVFGAYCSSCVEEKAVDPTVISSLHRVSVPSVHILSTLQRALAQRLSRCILIMCLHVFVRTPRTFSSFCPKHLPQGQVHAAAAKSLQSCPTLCDPVDCSPPGSPVPGILQARTLEWVAISFSTGT